MSAFNELVVGDHGQEELEIQFKFGVRRQTRYRTGDAIEFLPEDKVPAGLVEVPGIASGGGNDVWRFFAIAVIDGRISSYKEIDEKNYDALYKAFLY